MIQRCIVTLIATAAGLALPAHAFINPNFTPVNLVEQAETILLVEFTAVSDDGEAAANVIEVIKGAAPDGPLRFDFMAGPFEAKSRQILPAVAGADKRALLFIGAFERDSGDADDDDIARALLHVGNNWVTLSWYDEADCWDMDDIDQTLLGTWAGSDVMLRRAVRYVLSDPMADIPIRSNAS